MQHVKIIVYGQVQGVSFRYYAQKAALKLGLAGFVKNRPDGTVYIEVEGDRQVIEKFIAWCRKGSPWAKVEKVEYSFSKNLKGFKGFGIVYDS
jgi:acylphosphatase